MQFLAPGVYIEQATRQAPTTEGVSTSTAAFVGFTQRGPVNEAVLITSFDRFLEVFGDFTVESDTALSVSAFFNNGGRQAYVSRVVPSDATKGDAKVLSQYRLGEAGEGDGTTAISETAVSSGFETSDGDTPIQAGTVDLTWRAEGTPVATETLKQLDGTTDLDGVAGQAAYAGRIDPDSLETPWPGLLGVVPDGTVALDWTTGAAPATTISIPDPAAGETVSTVTAVSGTVVAFDFLTGHISIDFDAAELPDDATAIELSYTPATGDPGAQATATVGSGTDGTVTITAVDPGTAANSWQVEVIDPNADSSPLAASFSAGVLTVSLATDGAGALIPADNEATDLEAAIALLPQFNAVASGTGSDVVPETALRFFTGGRDALPYWCATDDGAGALVNGDNCSSLAASGTIDYDTGAFAATTISGAEPYDGAVIRADYQTQIWAFAPLAEGSWSDNLRLTITGNVDGLDRDTSQYSLFDVTVDIFDPNTGIFEVFETYTGVSLTDASSSTYLPEIIDRLSTLIVFDTPYSDEAPLQLQGQARTLVVSAGDSTGGNRTIDNDLIAPYGNIEQRSLTITYTDITGNERTITDDGGGNLIGSVDSAGDNTIDYEDGDLDVTTEFGIQAASLVTVTWSVPAELTTVTEQVGDASKGYGSGTNGTFDAVNYDRNQFTNPNLSASFSGIYALDRQSALMNLSIPDFASDPTITRDLLTYADGRETRPAGPDRFILVSPPVELDTQGAADWINFTVNQFSRYGAAYWPWVRTTDPRDPQREVQLPPVGHVAGVFARTDAQFNVSRAPAGLATGQLRGINGLTAQLSMDEIGTLTQAKINALRNDPEANIPNTVWGGRTLSTLDEWKYIQSVRLFQFVGRSIYNSTQWIVFENNGPELWGLIATQLNSFLGQLYIEGYFRGASPDQGYAVKVDNTNNTEQTIDLGQVIIDVAIAPTKPAEFVRFRLAQRSLDF